MQIVELAAQLAAAGNPNLRGDAITAALLAEAGARAAAALVRISLAAAPDDERRSRAAQILQDGTASARAALSSATPARRIRDPVKSAPAETPFLPDHESRSRVSRIAC
jgi:formiminotetrahydrofolate cyclodeaminase